MYLLYPPIGFYYDSEKQQVTLNSKGLQMDFDMNDKVIFVFVVVNVIIIFHFLNHQMLLLFDAFCGQVCL